MTCIFADVDAANRDAQPVRDSFGAQCPLLSPYIHMFVVNSFQACIICEMCTIFPTWGLTCIPATQCCAPGLEIARIGLREQV